MATAILRPTSTITLGVTGIGYAGGATTVHGATGDGSTATAAARSNLQSAGTTELGVANATGVIPAGSYIKDVTLVAYSKSDVPTGTFSTKSGSSVENQLNMALGPSGSFYGWGDGPARTVAPDGAAWSLAKIDALSILINWPAHVVSTMYTGVAELYLIVSYFAPPLQPTLLTPSTGSTNADGNPTLGVQLQGSGDGQLQRAEWQLATNTAFTTSVKTVLQPTSKNIVGGATTQKPSPSLALTAGTWYVRARGLDEFGNYGPYTTANSFYSSHAPSATNMAPANGVTVVYTTNTNFSWTFSDPLPSDTQSAYRLIIQFSDGTVLFDSGKVSSSATSVNVALGATNKDKALTWKVALYDSSDGTAGYSQPVAFQISDAPTVTITSPANGAVLTTGRPTITWTSDGATTQYQRRIVITRVSDGAVVLSTYTTTASKTYTPTTNVLGNNTTYTIQVTVYDDDGLIGTKTNTFSTSYDVPDDVTYTVYAAGWDDQGFVRVAWTTPADGFFIDWRVYRRETGTTDWTLIATYTNSSIKRHDDWTAGSNKYYQYAVTQTAGRYGEVLESTLDPAAETYQLIGSHYWIINPLDSYENLRLDNVSNDDFTNEYERESMIIIGRGRKVNQGTRFGYAGTLQAKFRDNAYGTARDKRMELETIQASQETYLLRNPFGDVFQVSLGTPSFGRISGVSTQEFVDVSIPYEEVF